MSNWSKVTDACDHRYEVRVRKVPQGIPQGRIYVDVFYIYDLHTGKQVGGGAYNGTQLIKKIAVLEKEYTKKV